jgi:hypothetical protein
MTESQVIGKLFHVLWMAKECSAGVWRAPTYTRSVYSNDAGSYFQAQLIKTGSLEARAREAMHVEDRLPCE